MSTVLPSPDGGNLTRCSRIVASLSYRGDNLLGRMVTRSWPEQDEPVEELAQMISEAASKLETEMPPAGTFTPVATGHKLMRTASFIISSTIR